MQARRVFVWLVVLCGSALCFAQDGTVEAPDLTRYGEAVDLAALGGIVAFLIEVLTKPIVRLHPWRDWVNVALSQIVAFLAWRGEMLPATTVASVAVTGFVLAMNAAGANSLLLRPAVAATRSVSRGIASYRNGGTEPPAPPGPPPAG